MQELIPKIIIFVVTLTVALVLDRLVSKALRRVFEKTSLPSASIFINIVRGVIWSFAVISVLRPVFGIEPSGVIAALGIGSVALSLGLQVTVSNIIGGLTVTAGKVVEPGDMVSISDITGRITDINWRHTVVQDAMGSQIIVPNSVMNSTSINKLSEKGSRLTEFTVEVEPGYDLDAAADEALELVKAALAETDYGWSEADPLVLADGISSFGGVLTVIIFAKDFTVAGLARNTATRALGRCTWLSGAHSSSEAVTAAETAQEETA